MGEMSKEGREGRGRGREKRWEGGLAPYVQGGQTPLVVIVVVAVVVTGLADFINIQGGPKT